MSKVAAGSLAAKAGIAAGDKILAINGETVRDIIDLSFALSDENIRLLLEKKDGEKETLRFRKKYDQALGVEFESAVFDKINQCANNCLFCFVAQMPREVGLRRSLYVKDDDYRLSFLYGNFITLTNFTPDDLARIKRLHLSPLYVSVHTANSALRAKMMRNPQAALIMEQLEELAAAGIDFHAQIVLCPGLNDSKELDYTVKSLLALLPSALSLAVVPVGLTKFRAGCSPLNSFTPETARQVVEQIGEWQKKCRRQTGTSFVYLADEFYLLAGEKIPAAEFYDGFPQLENGVGIVRNFLEEWQNCSAPNCLAKNTLYPKKNSEHIINVVCGKAAEPILRELFAAENFSGADIRLVSAANDFFGHKVTVTGLLTGQDILKALSPAAGEVILPGIALKEGEEVFLDGMTVKELEKMLACPVKIAYNAAELKAFLTTGQVI